MASNVQINPKGSRQHDHTIRAKINNASTDQMQRLLGDAHSTGIENKSSVEWYLVTDHGSATINDWWAYNEGEFAIHAANDRAATLVVDYFKQHDMQAYCLRGEL